MARRVGVVSVDFEAGTAKFNAKVNEAKGKLIEFGTHGVSGVQATSGALRVMEGNMTNNIRAAERFLANTLKLGPALQAAFPVIGAVAFLGVIGELGKRVEAFAKNFIDAPAKITQSFLALNSSFRTSNDQLTLMGAHLENDIAKLEGKRENRLSEAILEAKVAADKLGESLDSDLGKLGKLLDENKAGLWDQLWGRTSDKGLREELFGSTGMGGFRGEIARITSAGGPGMSAALQSAYGQMIAQLDQEIKAERDRTPATYDLNGKVIGHRTTGDALLEELTGARSALMQQSTGITLQEHNAALTALKSKLTAEAANAAQDRPYDNKIKEIDAQLDGVKAKLSAIGAPESVQTIAKAFGEAQKAIEEVNKGLEKQHKQLTTAQEGQIRAKELTIASVEAETEWKTKLASSTASVDDRIRSQQLLTAAIGNGYEATRKANVETRLMQELGQHFSDQEWMGSHAGDVSALRTRFGAEYDAQNQTKVAESLDKLQDQIDLEKDLAAVQAQGAEAVRGATLAFNLAKIARDNDAVSAQRLMAAEMQLYAQERQNQTAEEVAKLNQKIEATERLAAATLKGADAVRQAKLANQLEDVRRDGDVSIPGVLGVGVRGMAAMSDDSATHDKQVAETAARSDRMQTLQDQLNLLEEAKQKYGDTLSIDIAIRDIENQKLQAISDQLVALGGVRNGFKSFLVEMERDEDNASQQMAKNFKEAMTGAIDGVSDELARMMTGQYKKGDFGKMFQREGESLLKSTMDTGIHAGIGALAKHLGIKMPSRPDGTAGNPYHVIVENPNGTLSQGSAEGSGILGGAGGLFGQAGTAAASGFAKIGSWLASIFTSSGSATSSITYGPGHALGGPVDPGVIYPVGEHGMEYFAPRVPGTIIPNGGLGRGGDLHIHVDARGAEVGVEARVAQAIHSSAVAHAVRANAEHTRRTPRKG